MTEGFVVPKHPIPINLKLAWLPPKELELYLAEHAARHTGAEHPSDVLNGNDLFIPARDADGRHLLFQRTEVMVISVAAKHEERQVDEGESEEGATTIELELTLEDGTRVEGVISYWRPPGQRRLQDYLNTSEQFVRIREGDIVHVVNRDKIVSVVAR
jgi:hypothetical protein